MEGAGTGQAVQSTSADRNEILFAMCGKASKNVAEEEMEKEEA